MSDPFMLYGEAFSSRLLLGTARYPSPALLEQAVLASGAQWITVSLRRQDPSRAGGQAFWELLRRLPCRILPNTAGCHSVKEALNTAYMARELFNSEWIKLEIIGDDYTLQPDPLGLLHATEQLLKDGFKVLPYCTDDLVLAQRLVALGCQVLMPWGAPIGTGKGLLNPYALRVLRQRLPDTTLIVDAGLGLPSHACQALELGFDGVLLNTAVAQALDPVAMAQAFAAAVSAGRTAYRAGPMPERDQAVPSTPVLGTPFWHSGVGS